MTRQAMTLCLNPQCPNPQNPNPQASNSQGSKLGLTCTACGRSLLVGDRYRPIELLGEGGFGRTFRAWDTVPGGVGDCVIKQILPRAAIAGDPAQQSAFKARFDQEVAQLRQLGRHPQIPQLYGAGSSANGYFLVQQWIPGQTLAQTVASCGPLNEAELRDFLQQILPVLQMIHAAQVIHRDLKPANLIQHSADRRYVLVDFGASRLVSQKALQQTGTVIGSPGYVAPEQAVGKAVFASDLYSLGATCIYALTGEHPFELYAVGEDRWVWQPYAQSPVSPQLAQIINRLLERSLDRRYTNAEQVLIDLRSPLAPISNRQPAADQGDLNGAKPSQLNPFKGGKIDFSLSRLNRLKGNLLKQIPFRQNLSKASSQAFRAQSSLTQSPSFQPSIGSQLNVTRGLTLAQPDGAAVTALAVSPDGKAIA
ncbi:MAG: serine/threonine-protein kinase, partial [Cyanobacteria bacterium P01_D01_bin.128]